VDFLREHQYLPVDISFPGHQVTPMQVSPAISDLLREQMGSMRAIEGGGGRSHGLDGDGEELKGQAHTLKQEKDKERVRGGAYHRCSFQSCRRAGDSLLRSKRMIGRPDASVIAPQPRNKVDKWVYERATRRLTST
jgi:hypothetical protein